MSYTVEYPYYREVLINCGDNLVSVQRMVLPNSDVIYIHGVSHGGYTEADGTDGNSNVQAHIDRLLRGVLPFDNPAPGCANVTTTGSIPETATMRAELQLTPSTLGTKTLLSIDYNGTGHVDERRPPDFFNGILVAPLSVTAGRSCE